MTPPHSEAVRLKLESGNEVEALVRIERAAGKRPKCLLLHGNPGSLLDFEQLLPRLASAADIAAIDLPGFGRSPRPGSSAQSLSLERLAEQAIFAADALGFREPIFLVGHSHGGGVAQVAAARYPERVAGLALIGTLGAPAHASYRLLSLPGAAAITRVAGWIFRNPRLRSLCRIILRGVMSDSFSPEPVPAQTLERELSLLASRPEILLSIVQVTLGRPSAKLLDYAPALRCPTLFLHGREDAVVPAKCSRAIHDRILASGGRSHFELIPGAGHMLLSYQATELATLIVRRLLGVSEPWAVSAASE
jgi:pimeloyl-ACP methyl ester carboxylesterase